MIEEARIIALAQHAAEYAYRNMMSHTAIDEISAMEAAKDAGDRFAVALTLSLIEHGIAVSKMAEVR